MKVSVIISTLNQPYYIKTAVASILRNNYQNFEVLIIDQSTDDLTKSIAQSYLKQDNRIRYFHVSTKGKSRGLNYGIRMSEGKIVAITDSDCQVSEDWIEKIIFVFNRFPDVDIVYGTVIPEIDHEKKWFVPGNILEDRVFSGPRSKIFALTMGANMAIRKRVFENIGYFDELLGAGGVFCGGEEVDFSYRALKKGYKVAHSSKVTLTHYGRRNIDEFQRLIMMYRVADAVVFSKHIRCYDLNAGYVLIGLYLTNIRRISKNTDFDNKWLTQRIIYKFYMFCVLTLCFLKGIILSMRYPVDKKKLIFRFK